MTMWSIEIEKSGFSDYIITRTRKKKKYVFFGEEILVTEKFRGGCTVWHTYPEGNRCGTPMESWLSDIWTKERWREKDKKVIDRKFLECYK